MPTRANSGQPQNAQLVGGTNGDDISTTNPLPVTGTITATVSGGATAANQTTEINATTALRGYVGAEVPAQSDSVDLATPAAALYVGTGGAVKIDSWNHLGAAGGVRVTLTLANVPDGTTLTLPILRVWSTGTTASSLAVEF